MVLMQPLSKADTFSLSKAGILALSMSFIALTIAYSEA